VDNGDWGVGKEGGSYKNWILLSADQCVGSWVRVFHQLTTSITLVLLYRRNVIILIGVGKCLIEMTSVEVIISTTTPARPPVLDWSGLPYCEYCYIIFHLPIL